MEENSIPGLDPERIARLVGVALNPEGDEKPDDDAIGERLQARLEETPWTQDRRHRRWPKAIGRLLGARRSQARVSVADLLLLSLIHI